jgi:cytochrome c oxidase cbb3-type subunit 3
MKKLILLTLIGCSQTTTPPDAGTPKVVKPDVPKHPGERTYLMYCTSCHGYNGQGNNGLGADFVNDKTRLAKRDVELFNSIWRGRGRMPAWRGILKIEEVLDVLAYIRHEFGDKSKSD